MRRSSRCGDQPNAPKPGSAIDKFSFVGAPFTDRSSVVYYVDDVAIGTDERVPRSPFVAPGRRKLFIDSFVSTSSSSASDPAACLRSTRRTSGSPRTTSPRCRPRASPAGRRS